MGDHVDTLAQRFLDGELARADRQALLRLLGEEPSLRQRLLDSEAMLEAAASLPRATPSPEFLDRTLAALRHGSAPRQRRTRRLGPAVRWVSAAAAASLLLAGGFWIGRSSQPALPPAAATATSPDTSAEVLVRLVLIQPQARSVAVVGDFNGWDPSRSPLERREGGAWTTLLPLAAGQYQYMFLVDGSQWLPDPFATETATDGFGAWNSVLDVEL